MADGASERRELDEATSRLVGLLADKTRGWAEIYSVIAHVEAEQLWRAEYTSVTKWLEALARTAGVQITYIWRLRKAGRFYSAYLERQAARGQLAPEISQVAMGDEMLADLDRISEGDAARADRYIELALSGDLTKSRVKEILRATTRRRRAARESARAERSAASGAEAAKAAQVARDEAAAADVLSAIVPDAIYDPGDERLTRRLLRGERRVWEVMPEFPCGSATSDRVRRIDAMVITNVEGDGAAGMAGCPQDQVTLHGVEIKVSRSDLLRDRKHLEYEPYCDYCWYGMPETLWHEVSGCREEWLSDGWGVLVLGQDGRLVPAVPSARRPAVMRDVALSAALIRLASRM